MINQHTPSFDAFRSLIAVNSVKDWWKLLGNFGCSSVLIHKRKLALTISAVSLGRFQTLFLLVICGNISYFLSVQTFLSFSSCVGRYENVTYSINWFVEDTQAQVTVSQEYPDIFSHELLQQRTRMEKAQHPKNCQEKCKMITTQPLYRKVQETDEHILMTIYQNTVHTNLCL